MTGWTITGGQVLREARIAPGTLALSDGVVAGDAAPAARHFDAAGLLVMPGIVDIHGDAHERQFQPRPGVSIPAPQALRDSAAQILAAGITTAFLGVTLSWEPGLRSLEAWKTLLAELETARPSLAADLRVHLRFEVDNLAALDTALADIAAGRVDLVAFNDHTPSIARKLVKEAAASKYAERAGVGVAEIRAMAETVLAERHAMPAARERLAAAARARGLSMLSHDDATLEDRALHRALGAAICEFPMAEEVGRDARARGEDVVMGAPNVVRGGSHLGWASAAPLAEQGIVTILASDYVWPCLMQAAFILEGRGVLDLAAAWALISANPARAAGLKDRGRLATGLRGDVVVVDPASRSTVAVFCAGELSWVAPQAAARI